MSVPAIILSTVNVNGYVQLSNKGDTSWYDTTAHQYYFRFNGCVNAMVIDEEETIWLIAREVKASQYNRPHLYKSTDGGLTWTFVIEISTRGTTNSSGVDFASVTLAYDQTRRRLHVVWSPGFSFTWINHRWYDIDTETLGTDNEIAHAGYPPLTAAVEPSTGNLLIVYTENGGSGRHRWVIIDPNGVINTGSGPNHLGAAFFLPSMVWNPIHEKFFLLQGRNNAGDQTDFFSYQLVGATGVIITPNPPETGNPFTVTHTEPRAGAPAGESNILKLIVDITGEMHAVVASGDPTSSLWYNCTTDGVWGTEENWDTISPTSYAVNPSVGALRDGSVWLAWHLNTTRHAIYKRIAPNTYVAQSISWTPYGNHAFDFGLDLAANLPILNESPEVQSTPIGAGIVSAETVEVFDTTKTINFSVLGPMKELETVPYWMLTQENGPFLSLHGIEVVSYTPVSGAKTAQGPRPLSYTFPDGDPLETVAVNNVRWDNSLDSMHYLTYRLMGRTISYAGGTFAYLEENHPDNTTRISQVLKGADIFTQQIEVTPGLHPTRDVTVLMNVVTQLENGRYERSLAGKGLATLRFDGGAKVELRDFFDAVITYIGASYADVTPQMLVEGGGAIDLFGGPADYLYVGDSQVFQSVEFVLDTPFPSPVTVTAQYSKFYQGWETLTLGNDLTNGLTQSGRLSFTLPTDWTATTLEAGGSIGNVGGKYFVRFSVNNTTANLASALSLRRSVSVIGVKGDILEVAINEALLPRQSIEDEIIIRERSFQDPTIITASYYQNITPAYLARKIATSAGYPTSSQDIDALTLRTINPAIWVMGKPPILDYPYSPTAILPVSGVDALFLGVGPELWMNSSMTEWTHIDDLLIGSKASIIDLRYDSGDGKIYVLAMAIRPSGQSPSSVPSVHAGVGVTNTNRTAFASNFIPSGLYQNNVIKPGHEFNRQGTYVAVDKNCIGTSTLVDAGEQIAIPYPQSTCISGTSQFLFALYDAVSLYQNITSGAGRFYYSSGPSTGFPVGSAAGAIFYETPAGFYQLNDNSSGDGDFGGLYFRFSFGQERIHDFDPVEKMFIIDYAEREGDGLTPPRSSLRYLDPTTKNTYPYGVPTPGVVSVPAAFQQHLEWDWTALAYYQETRQVYAAGVSWYDHGTNSASYCYLTRLWFNNTTGTQPWPFDKIFFHDQSLGAGDASFSDQTAVGASGSMAIVLNEADDAFYVGNTSRQFFSVQIAVTTSTLVSTIAWEYWNGVAWTDLTSVTDGSVVDWGNNLTESDPISFKIPRDWTQVSLNSALSLTVDSTSRYWVRARLNSFTSGATTITRLIQQGEVVWDASDGYPSSTIIDLVYDESKEVFHGVGLNKETLTWYYVIFNPTTLEYGEYTILVDSADRSDRVLKHLYYWPATQKVYAYMVDVKYQLSAAELIEITYYPSGTGLVTMTSLGTLGTGEVNVGPGGIKGDDNDLYGITANGILWKYSDIVHPIIQYAKLDAGTNCRTALTLLAQLVNAVVYITPERIMSLKKRYPFPTIVKVLNHNHLVKVEPITHWRNQFKGIIVPWEDISLGITGQEVYGDIGFGKPVLTISNPLVQYRQLAVLMSKIYGKFFTKLIRTRKVTTILLPQLRLGYGVKLVVPSTLGMESPDRIWTIINIQHDCVQNQTSLDLIESEE